MAEACDLVHFDDPTSINILLNEEKVKPEFGSDKDGSSVWYFDTGANNHMTGCKKNFAELDEVVHSKVRFSDRSVVNICGRETMLFQCNNREHMILTNVYYIPKLKSNIVSIRHLNKYGGKIVIERAFLHLFEKQRKLVAKVRRSKNRLYVVNIIHVQPMYLITSYKEDVRL